MNVKNVLTANAIWVALIALVSIVAPTFLIEREGVEATDLAINLTRMVGAASVGYGITSWLMRSVPASPGRRAFLIGGGIGYFVIAAVFLLNMFTSDLGNTMTWVYIVISALFGLDFIFFGKDDPTGKK